MLNNRVFRYTLICLVLLLTLAPVVPVSAQGKPIRTPFPQSPFILEGVCEFDVYWEPLKDNSYVTVSTEKDGTRYLYTGILKTRLTNLDTGTSVDRTITGQMVQVFYTDGSYRAALKGQFLGFWEFPSNPPLSYIKGQQVIQYDANGNLIEASQSGKVEDLCAALAE